MGVRFVGIPALERYLESQYESIVEEMLYRLNYLGADAVRFVRDRSKEDSWEDQTGNLRSSIGYVIVKDGAVIGSSGFERVNGPHRESSDVDGSVEGRNFAEHLAERYPQGYALIVVAGMEYAASLEALDNKDVLASGELHLKKQLKEMTRKLKEKYGR